MANSADTSDTNSAILKWAKYGADITEDTTRSIIGFLPNGLNLTYQFFFKRLPGMGKLFSHPTVEQMIKLFTGITIGQGIAIDLARYIFRPFGYFMGYLAGASAFTSKQNIPTYQGKIGKMAYRISGQAVGGASLSLILVILMGTLFHLPLLFSLKGLGFAALMGALLGLMAKTTMVMAINAVEKANAATVRKNVQRAKELNSKLQIAAKQKAKSRILMHAQDIILQINGPESQQELEAFFKAKYEAIAISTNKQIERHFNYLTDRACHGDLKALKRLQELVPTKQPVVVGGKNPFDVMLDRIFNPRSIFKLKDDVDTAFDRWHYEFLRKKAS